MTAVGGGANAGDGVHRQAYVAAIGQCGAASVDADPHSYEDLLRPGAGPDASLHRQRRSQRSSWPPEDRKQLVSADVDLMPAGPLLNQLKLGALSTAAGALVAFAGARVLHVGRFSLERSAGLG